MIISKLPDGMFSIKCTELELKDIIDSLEQFNDLEVKKND